MGKKRIASKGGDNKNNALRSRALQRGGKKKLASGILHVESTYNNTRVSLSDMDGNMFFTSSSGALGFKGAKKGTPFAAAKVGELIGEQALTAGVKEVRVVVKGVGAGRDSAVRAFIGKGIDIISIIDRTPVPHGGVTRRKPRRV
jgi:small subunit ribosomal protein S11